MLLFLSPWLLIDLLEENEKLETGLRLQLLFRCMAADIFSIVSCVSSLFGVPAPMKGPKIINCRARSKIAESLNAPEKRPVERSSAVQQMRVFKVSPIHGSGPHRARTFGKTKPKGKQFQQATIENSVGLSKWKFYTRKRTGLQSNSMRGRMTILDTTIAEQLNRAQGPPVTDYASMSFLFSSKLSGLVQCHRYPWQKR